MLVEDMKCLEDMKGIVLFTVIVHCEQSTTAATVNCV